ncbi:MAG: LicD family protein [Clostridia bacterium]|nr:LicD family protein [Clostridia bacterium]
MYEEIRALQLVELDIMRKVLDICDRHDLKYFMLGGTLLGAIRHKGFIPWDDDMDIGMPRPDYEKFIRIAAEELKAPYQLHAIQNEKLKLDYYYYYARVENTDVMLERQGTLKYNMIPAWVDIFPLDGAPSKPLEMRKWFTDIEKRSKWFLRAQASYYARSMERRDPKSIKAKIMRIVVSMKLDRLISTKHTWKKLDEVVRRYNYDECAYLANCLGYWAEREYFHKMIYGEGKMYQFEDLQLRGPEDYDFVLKQMYMDYMTPPPETDRDHHFIKIKKD